jgi:hypothetical protein
MAAIWVKAADTLDGPAEAIRCRPVFRAFASYGGAAGMRP